VHAVFPIYVFVNTPAGEQIYPEGQAATFVVFEASGVLTQLLG